MHTEDSNRLAWRGILLALALAVLAGLLRIWPLQALGTHVLYTTYYPAVIIAAVYGGIWAGLLAMFLSCAQVFFAGPVLFGESAMKDFIDWLGMGVFVVNCTAMSGIAEVLRRSRSRASRTQLELERNNADLQAARETLEDKVRLATAELTQTNITLERELTERRAAEEELRKARDELESRVEERTAELEKTKDAVATERQRLYDILETMPMMVCLLTPDYHVAFANRSFRDKFGGDSGRRCYEYCFGREEPCEFCETYSVLQTGQPHHWEVSGLDGSVIEAYDFPFSDVDGSPLILEVGVDVTDQRRAQEAVRAERQRFNNVLDSLPAYVVLLTPDYHVPFANRFFEERFGESHGRRCFEYLFGRTEPCETCETYSVLRTNAPHHWEWIGPDGCNYDIYDFPFTDTDGSRLIMEVGLDITETKHAQAERENLITELEAKNLELERFIYSVSHDLKSPLITILAFKGFVEDAVAKGNTDNLKADLDRISNAASKMGQLLDEVLELSRIGRMVNPSTTVPMQELVDEALEILSGRLTERGVRIKVTSDLPVLYGDRPRLLEVLQNLIENAVKFMGDQPAPEIEIGAFYGEKEPVLYVQDNGTGIEPCYHDRIFRLFDKLDPKTEGTGIGLAMVKRIIEVHNGTIRVESSIGEGSKFCFTLPGTVRAGDEGRRT